jgi:hypothetical protein
MDKEKNKLSGLIVRIIAAIISLVIFVLEFPLLLFSFYPVGLITAIISVLLLITASVLRFCFKFGQTKVFDGLFFGAISIPPALLCALWLLIQTGILHFPG